MAKVFSSGLEIGAPEVYYVNSGWTSTQTGTSTVDFAYDEAHTPGTGYGGGDRCFKAASTGYGAAKFAPPALTTATSDGWVAFSWKATGASTIDRDVWVRITNATSHTDTIDGLVLKGKPTGTTYTLTVTAGGKPLGSTTNIANDGAWHHIGIHYKAHATSGVVAIYYDGSLILNYSGDTRGLGDTTTWDKVTWVHGVENDMGDGSDGSITVSSPAVLNKYTYLTETTTAATVKEVLVYDSTNFSVGDEIMLHQTQHATAAGTYEFNRINTIQTKRSLPGSTAWFNQEGVVGHWHFDEAPTPFPDNGATDGFVDMTGNVLLWHFNGNVTDSSGKGNHGQLVNGPAVVTGRVGESAYDFNGANQYIDVDLGADAPTTAGSFSAWIMPDVSTAAHPQLGLGDISTVGSWRVLSMQGTGNLAFWGFSADVADITALSIDIWHHVVCTWENTDDIKIYLDGALVHSSTIAALITPGARFIVGNRPDLLTYSNLRVDEVAVWNRTLSQAEVTAIYDAQKNPTQLTDASGKANHLTVLGNGVAGDYNYFSQPGKWTGSTTYVHGIKNLNSWGLASTSMTDMPIGNTPRTIMFWFKPLEFHGDSRNVISYGEYDAGTAHGGIYAQLDSGVGAFRWGTNGSSGNNSLSNITTTLNTWSHLALVWTGSSFRAYHNGAYHAFVSGMPSTINTVAGAVGIGMHYWNGTPGAADSVHAEFDEFVILDYALTDDEIAAIFAVQNAATTAADAYLPVVVYDSDWVSTANMELYYKLDEAVSATGADSIIDYSGNGYNGTPTSMTMGAAGQVGTCGTFGGGNINAGYNSQLDFERTDSFTMGMWFKTTTTAYTVMLSNLQSSPLLGWAVNMRGQDSGRFQIEIYQSNTVGLEVRTTTTGFNDGNWHHAVVTYSGSSVVAGIQLYIDGALQAMTPGGGPLNATTRCPLDVTVGSFPSGGSSYIGLLDEVFIYSRGLSAAEIQTIYRVQSDNYHTVGLTKGLKTPFYSGTFDTAAPNGVVSQMVKVPNYTALTVDAGGSVTADAWDGYKGGILALKATGAATIAGTISADGAGYRGGVGTSGTGFDEVRGYQGESIIGKGILASVANDGGGASTKGHTGGNGQQNSGGGGGGYGTVGGVGLADVSAGGTYDAPGGTIVGSADLEKIHLGSGGAGGGRYTTSGALTTGGSGGGAIYLAAETITVAGTIKTTGITGEDSGHVNSSNSGAGSGGAVYLAANTVTAGSGLVTAAGGAAQTGQADNGDGGAGGDGRIRTNYATTTGTTTPTAYADAVPATMSDQFDHLVIFDAPGDPGNSKMFIQGVRPNATFDAGAFVVDGNHLSSDWFDMTGCEGLYHLDETTGTVATDSSGNSRNGALVGVPGFTTGKVGPTPRGYEFNGTSDEINLGVNAAFQFTKDTPLSFGCWIKSSSMSGSWDVLLSSYYNSVGFEVMVGVSTGAYVGIGQLNIYFQSGSNYIQAISGDTTAMDGNWHHVCFTFTGNGATSGFAIYLDGAAVSIPTQSTQGSIVATVSPHNLTIGRKPTSAAEPFSGDMDEVFIFSRALSAAEVKSIYDYQAPAPLAFPDNGTADGYVSMVDNELLCHFDGNADDSSGNNRDGTPTNSPTQVTGRVGANAYSFDGSNDYIDFGVHSAFQFTTGSFSIAFWVKPGASNAAYRLLMSTHGVGAGGILIQPSGTDGPYDFWTNDGSSWVGNSGVTLTKQVWTHVVWTKAGTVSTVYLNGSSASVATTHATVQAGSNLHVGRSPRYANYWSGEVDEFAIFSRAITQAEVTAIYNNQAPVGNPRLHQAIDDTGDLTTTSKIIAPSATSCKFGMEGATDINAAWAPGTIIAVDAVAAIRGDGSITAAKVDIGGVGGGETVGTSTAISPNPRIVTATAVVDPDGAGAITTTILNGLTTKVTVS